VQRGQGTPEVFELQAFLVVQRRVSGHIFWASQRALASRGTVRTKRRTPASALFASIRSLNASLQALPPPLPCWYLNAVKEDYDCIPLVLASIVAPIFISQLFRPIQVPSQLSQHACFSLHAYVSLFVLGLPGIDTTAWSCVSSSDDPKAISP